MVIDGVSESAVIGVPHPDFGEGVAGDVARHPGSALNTEAIGEVVSRETAAFKRPQTSIIDDELPRNAMGKVQKAELRNHFNDIFAKSSV